MTMWSALLALAFAVACTIGTAAARGREVDQSDPQAAGLRHLVPERWWEKAAALYVGTLKPDRGYGSVFPLDPAKAAEELAAIRAQGFQAIEVFAPAAGRYAYAGLDMTDPYRIDPELGTMEDFRRFVRLAHGNGLAVVVFFNLGYFSIEAPAWLEACRDKKAGRDTEKVRWFSWADRPDAPPPAPPEDVYFTDMIPPKDDPETPKTWGWQYGELAGCYYWSRWEGKDKDGNLVGLPQMNWASPEWPQEAERIIRCWMETGLDGMIVDAPGCYQGLTWESNNRHITSVIASYGNTFILPEGVSEAMLLAPSRNMPWLTEGGYNGLINYGLGLSGGTWQDNRSSVVDAIESGDPRPIEESLRAYHDLAVAAGGVLYCRLGRRRLDDPQQSMLQVATLAGVGEMLVYRARGRPELGAEEQWLLRMRYGHPALHQFAARRQLPTNADSKYYAFLKVAQDGSERVLVVLNFQSSPQTIAVDLSRVATAGLIDLKTGERLERTLPLRVALPAYGYAFFEVLPARDGRV